jgi:hypothetical protein
MRIVEWMRGGAAARFASRAIIARARAATFIHCNWNHTAAKWRVLQ